MGQSSATLGASDVSASERSLNNPRRWMGGMPPGLALFGLGALALAAPVLLRGTAVTAPALRAALETMLTLFALAAAWLLRVQFASSRRLRDLQLLAAALVLGFINFADYAVPAALDLHNASYYAIAQLWGKVFVGAMFAWAAFAPSEWLIVRRRHPVLITTGLILGGITTAGLGALLVAGRASGQRLDATVGHPLLVMLVVAGAALLADAAVGFVRRQRIEADRVAGLLAAAMILLAGAAFSNLLPGSLVAGRIGAGEVLRTFAFALILAAAVIRERQVQARMSKATALAERRRVARDLHDGIAQDLAFIAAHGPRFVQELGDDHPIVVAARRALAISRSTISDLSDDDGATAHESLQALAQELAERFGISIAVNAELDRELGAHEREHVTRIAREAIANAARHGGAQNVIVSLRHADTGIALRVIDDGRGIAGADLGPTPEGFGLRSMRERAASLGGELNVHQPRRGGTELEIVLP